jgi:hypothetical protein
MESGDDNGSELEGAGDVTVSHASEGDGLMARGPEEAWLSLKGTKVNFSISTDWCDEFIRKWLIGVADTVRISPLNSLRCFSEDAAVFLLRTLSLLVALLLLARAGVVDLLLSLLLCMV